MKLQENRKRSISNDMSDDDRDIDIESDVCIDFKLCTKI